MSVVPSRHTIFNHKTYSVRWRTGEPEMIPPGEDALMIRFMLYKTTWQSFTPCPGGEIQEKWVIPDAPTKAITVCPSKFLLHNAKTIRCSPSGLMIREFVYTHFPPKYRKYFVCRRLWEKIVRLVISAVGSETKGFVDVRLVDTVEVLHYLKDDEATRASMQGYFEATSRGTCAICTDDYEIHRDDGIRLPCLHAFHGSCISKWHQINPNCPICSFPYGPPEIAPWFNPPVQDGIYLSHSRIASG